MQNQYNTVCYCSDLFVQKVQQEKQRQDHANLTKRYHEFVYDFDNDKTFSSKNGEDLCLKRKNDIHVRYHQNNFKKQIKSNAKRCKSSICISFAHTENTPSSQKGVCVRYKRVSLPITVLAPLALQSKSKAGFFTNISLLNTHRERVRRKRTILLQKSTNQSFKDRRDVKDLIEKGIQSMSAPAQRKDHTSKGVWRGFINTFMRNGEKLRYQKILRNGLLAQ